MIDLGSARKSRALNNGIARLASRIDAHIFDVAAKAFNHSTGTGAPPSPTRSTSPRRARAAEASLGRMPG